MKIRFGSIRARIENLISNWFWFFRIVASDTIGLGRFDFLPLVIKRDTKRFSDWFRMIRIGSEWIPIQIIRQGIFSIFDIFQKSYFIICRMLSSLRHFSFFFISGTLKSFKAAVILLLLFYEPPRNISAITPYFDGKQFLELHWIMLNTV